MGCCSWAGLAVISFCISERTDYKCRLSSGKRASNARPYELPAALTKTVTGGTGRISSLQGGGSFSVFSAASTPGRRNICIGADLMRL